MASATSPLEVDRAFQSVDVNLGGQKELLAALAALSSAVGLDADDLALKWEAYSCNHGVAAPTKEGVEDFGHFVRDSERAKERARAKAQKKGRRSVTHRAPPRPARVDRDTLAASSGGGTAQSFDDILGFKLQPSRKRGRNDPSSSSSSSSAASASAVKKEAADDLAAASGGNVTASTRRRSDTFFSPSAALAASPAASASPFASRATRGDTQFSYNDGLDSWAARDAPVPDTDADLGRVASFEVLGAHAGEDGAAFRFMHQSTHDRADFLLDGLDRFAERTMDTLREGGVNADAAAEMAAAAEAAHQELAGAGVAAAAADAVADRKDDDDDEDGGGGGGGGKEEEGPGGDTEMKDAAVPAAAAYEPEFSPVSEQNQEAVLAVGRVRCEAPKGRLNAASVLLDGDMGVSRGQHVKLDLREQSEYSLFPGQLLAVKGVNATGRALVVQRLLRVPPAAPLALPPADVARYSRALAAGGGRPLGVCVAAGPFTLRGDTDFAPLADLLVTVRERKPDVLLLIGPFVDTEHDAVRHGRLGAVTHEQHFAEVLEQVAKATRLLPTRVLLMPSSRDAHHHPCFPQPPFRAAVPLPGNMTLLPNPAVFRVNDVTFAACGEDLLGALNKAEVGARSAGRPRLSDLAAHLARQESFMPLFPPPEEVPVDYAHADRLRIPFAPDVLVTPSVLKAFGERVAGDTVFVNPGRLAKGNGGGTYAAFSVHPLREDQIAAAESGSKADDADDFVQENTRPATRMRVDIVRV